MSETATISHKVEHTDTYGGEANYSWCKTYNIEDNGGDLSNVALVRRAKALCGLTGHRCNVSNYGDMIEIRPRGICQVIFIY